MALETQDIPPSEGKGFYRILRNGKIQIKLHEMVGQREMWLCVKELTAALGSEMDLLSPFSGNHIVKITAECGI